MKRATLRDIAQALGITVATVSRALKDYPDISAATKLAVLTTAERLHYAPHPLAVKLRQKAYKVVGVVVPDIVHPFFADVISGIVDVVEALGYHVILSQSNESYEKEIRVTQMLQATGVDGLLVCLSNETVAVDHLRALQDYNLPVVLFDKISSGLDASTVVTNDFQGAYDAVAHLLDQGYTRVAHLKGPAHPENTRQRFAGYQAALAAYGLPFRPEYVLECQAVTHAEGFAFAQQLLALPEPPQAIFAVTDSVAIGAITALKQAGRRVPQDVAVIGFSDWAVCQLLEPTVSSVAQPGYDIGRRASELLLREIQQLRDEQPPEHSHLVLDATVRVRQSSQRPLPGGA
ncbi:transcriptional regulator, LacI family [Hymenobacter daecheongensis DSM 21074]|uniref:Transcriptional regulator, LacI family n=1 Tax=Hymenobacter daecheongensis DSM 21074 TaxID=1121955 RepID=A0A1M6I0T3_9BACT|nr:LacI family DNA-binding transcriptional regulator [Hymenobacter daecheongensis]SHJ28099.1 transcriptional regulator, LacI family [Hymenobacter daecheongensis DSM 21074]